MKKQIKLNQKIQCAFFLTVAVFLTACGGKSDVAPNSSIVVSNNSDAVSQSSAATAISAVDLYNAYKKDAAAADARFKGKPLTVTGEIFLATEKSITGVPVAAFKVDNKDGVSCKFPEQQKDAVGKLKEGQTATFNCEVKGAIALSSFYGVELQNCAVVK